MKVASIECTKMLGKALDEYVRTPAMRSKYTKEYGWDEPLRTLQKRVSELRQLHTNMLILAQNDYMGSKVIVNPQLMVSVTEISSLNLFFDFLKNEGKL